MRVGVGEGRWRKKRRGWAELKVGGGGDGGGGDGGDGDDGDARTDRR
jgi:hypothetical protein